MKIPKFQNGTLESVAREIAELYSGTQLTSILAETGVSVFDVVSPTTKWKRLVNAIDRQQTWQGDGQPLIKLMQTVFSPHNLMRIKVDVDNDSVRSKVNTILSLEGFRVNENGSVSRVKKTNTVGEAQQRSDQLRAYLELRGAHSEVLRHCRAELLRKDYYEAAFESIKGLGDRLRRLSGLDLDGRKLVQNTLNKNNPRVRVNPGLTASDRNEQEGTMLLAEGLFAAFRNPAAHEPRLLWHMSEQDALDVMGLVSLIHRRIDNAEARGH